MTHRPRPIHFYSGRANISGDIPRNFRADELEDINHDPRLLALAHQHYLEVFGTHEHPQSRSNSVQAEEGQSIDESLGKHGQGTHRPSLTSSADALRLPFGQFCVRGNYCFRCKYECEVSHDI